MSDRQPSEEPEEQVDLEGDDDGMDDDDGGYRRRGSRDDSEEPEEDDDNDERHGDGDGRGDDDAGMEPEPAGGGGSGKGGDETGKGADAAEGSGPEDEEERSKWDELLALPPHGSQVFIGGLPRDTTEDDLREMCEPLGEIYEVRLTKKDANESKGFAFVTFTDKDAAQRAIEDIQDREYKGRTLRCSLSQAKHRLFIGNVPKGLSEEELTNIIKGKGPGVVNIEMFKDQHDPNRNRGFLFVEYYNHACAEYARQKLSSRSFKVDGSQLTVSWAEPKGSTDPSSAAAQILLPCYRDGLYTLFIMDMQKKTMHIMGPLPDDVCYKGFAQIMPYIATFHTTAKRFSLAMKLINSKWDGNIYYWKRIFHACVTKVPKYKDWCLISMVVDMHASTLACMLLGLACFAYMQKLSVCVCGCTADTCLLHGITGCPQKKYLVPSNRHLVVSSALSSSLSPCPLPSPAPAPPLTAPPLPIACTGGAPSLAPAPPPLAVGRRRPPARRTSASTPERLVPLGTTWCQRPSVAGLVPQRNPTMLLPKGTMLEVRSSSHSPSMPPSNSSSFLPRGCPPPPPADPAPPRLLYDFLYQLIHDSSPLCAQHDLTQMPLVSSSSCTFTEGVSGFPFFPVVMC